MRFIFPPSSRPDIVVDPFSTRTQDPASSTNLGMPGPLGRGRVVSALPTNTMADGPTLLEQPQILVDEDGNSLGDPSGNLIGMPKIVVHRLLFARWTAATRR